MKEKFAPQSPLAQCATPIFAKHRAARTQSLAKFGRKLLTPNNDLSLGDALRRPWVHQLFR